MYLWLSSQPGMHAVVIFGEIKPMLDNSGSYTASYSIIHEARMRMIIRCFGRLFRVWTRWDV